MPSSPDTVTLRGSPTASMSPPNESDEPEPVFDGGGVAWRTLIGGWMTLFCTFGMVTAFAVFQDLYVRSGAATPANASWIGSVQIFFVIGMGFPAGKLLDKGYFRYAHLCGSLLYVFCMMMLSLASFDKYYQLILSQGVGMGISGGMLFMPSLAIQSHHWRRYRAFAMGLCISGTSAGGIVLPIMLNKLIDGPAGFGWGVRAAAFMIFGLLIIANLLMRPRKHKPAPPPPVVRRLPSDEDVEKAGSVAASSKEVQMRPSTLKEIMTDLPFQLVAVGLLLVQAGLFFPYFYLQLYTIVHGVDKTLAFYSIAILNAASLFGRTIPNLVADKTGSLNALIPSAGISGALIFLMLAIDNSGIMIGFAILYGFFSGAFLSLIAPSLASFAKHPAEMGTRMGIAFFISAFGALAGGPIEGALARSDTGYNWWKPSVYSGVVILAGTACCTIGRFMQASRKGISRL